MAMWKESSQPGRPDEKLRAPSENVS